MSATKKLSNVVRGFPFAPGAFELEASPIANDELAHKCSTCFDRQCLACTPTVEHFKRAETSDQAAWRTMVESWQTLH